MSKRESITRYALIIKKIQKAPASFAEISEYLEYESELQDYNFIISERTFKRDREDIEAIFGIEIEFDFSDKKYKITHDQFKEGTERLIEANDIFNALNISERIAKYIHFDKKTNAGTEHLYQLLKAIEKRKTITFDYQKYWEKAAPENREAAPYALKEFKNRWYLIAKDAKDEKIKTFALERIENLQTKKQKFDYPKDFDVKQYFEHSYGIFRAEIEDPQEIELAFHPDEADYLKMLPLHHSQEIIEDNEEEFVVRLKLNPTYDFIKELYAYGERLKVLQPKSLSQKMIENAKNILSYYE